MGLRVRAVLKRGGNELGERVSNEKCVHYVLGRMPFARHGTIRLARARGTQTKPINLFDARP